MSHHDIGRLIAETEYAIGRAQSLQWADECKEIEQDHPVGTWSYCGKCGENYCACGVKAYSARETLP